MAETLYRKYRPQCFADIHGQEGITRTLTNQIIRGTIAHAYLFAGTRGTGKTTSARVLAKAINCHGRASDSPEPCGVCPSCIDITAGRSVDVIELDAATHTGVDTVREEIIENARFMPTRDKFKIFIIDEVHMLSTSSFNALLKSLEEPPPHVAYILATTELHKIPATVASRCQRFIFRPLPLAIMESKLQSISAAEGVTVHPAVFRRILAASGGAMRDAESLLGQLLSIGSTEITESDADILLLPTLFGEAIDFLATLARGEQQASMALMQNLFEAGTDMPTFHDSVVKRAHELLVVRSTKEVPAYLGIYSDNETKKLQTHAPVIPAEWLARCITVLLEKKLLYRTISSPLIPLHLAIIEMTGATTAKAVAAPAPAAPKVVQPPAPTPITVVVAAPAPPVVVVSAPPPSDSLEDCLPDEPAMEQPSSDAQSSFAEIMGHWQHAVSQIVSKNPSLGIILSSVEINSVNSNTIQIGVRYPMYRDKLLDLRTKNMLEDCLSERCGMPMHYTVTAIEDSSALVDPAIDDIAQSFSGRVVI